VSVNAEADKMKTSLALIGVRHMRIALIVAAFLIAGVVQAATDCDVDLSSAVSPAAKALPLERFNGITTDWTTAAIIRQLGPASRDMGSGLYVLEWKMTDGRVFSVSTSSLCVKPFSAHFSK